MTELQKSAVRGQVKAKLSVIFSDFFDLESATNLLTPLVVEDIDETADWSDIDTDEVVVGDIDIALARVMLLQLFPDK